MSSFAQAIAPKIDVFYSCARYLGYPDDISNLLSFCQNSDLIDYDCFDASSVLSSRCSSTGTPSCSSSPCSSDREYGFEASSLPDSFYDIDDDNFGKSV